MSNIVWWSFWVLDRGIYYVDSEGERTRLRFLDFATGESRTLAPDLGPTQCCVTATPDGRTVLYSRIDAWSDDLMLVDGLR